MSAFGWPGGGAGVGRAVEMRRIQEWVTEDVARRPFALWLRGESGVGKSALSQRAMQEWPGVFGSVVCTAAEQMLAGVSVRRVLDAVHEAVVAAGAVAPAGEVAKIAWGRLSAFRHGLASVLGSTLLGADESVQVFREMQTVTMWEDARGRRVAVPARVLCIDDFQWMDAWSVEWGVRAFAPQANGGALVSGLFCVSREMPPTEWAEWTSVLSLAPFSLGEAIRCLDLELAARGVFDPAAKEIMAPGLQMDRSPFRVQLLAATFAADPQWARSAPGAAVKTILGHSWETALSPAARRLVVSVWLAGDALVPRGVDAGAHGSLARYLDTRAPEGDATPVSASVHRVVGAEAEAILAGWLLLDAAGNLAFTHDRYVEFVGSYDTALVLECARAAVRRVRRVLETDGSKASNAFLLRAVRIAELVGDRECFALASAHLALCYMRLGFYQEADVRATMPTDWGRLLQWRVWLIVAAGVSALQPDSQCVELMRVWVGRANAAEYDPRGSKTDEEESVAAALYGHMLCVECSASELEDVLARALACLKGRRLPRDLQDMLCSSVRVQLPEHGGASPISVQFESVWAHVLAARQLRASGAGGLGLAWAQTSSECVGATLSWDSETRRAWVVAKAATTEAISPADGAPMDLSKVLLAALAELQLAPPLAISMEFFASTSVALMNVHSVVRMLGVALDAPATQYIFELARQFGYQGMAERAQYQLWMSALHWVVRPKAVMIRDPQYWQNVLLHGAVQPRYISGTILQWRAAVIAGEEMFRAQVVAHALNGREKISGIGNMEARAILVLEIALGRLGMSEDEKVARGLFPEAVLSTCIAVLQGGVSSDGHVEQVMYLRRHLPRHEQARFDEFLHGYFAGRQDAAPFRPTFQAAGISVYGAPAWQSMTQGAVARAAQAYRARREALAASGVLAALQGEAARVFGRNVFGGWQDLGFSFDALQHHVDREVDVLLSEAKPGWRELFA